MFTVAGFNNRTGEYTGLVKIRCIRCGKSATTADWTEHAGDVALLSNLLRWAEGHACPPVGVQDLTQAIPPDSHS